MKPENEYRFDDENVLVLEQPLENPVQVINSFFGWWDWEETKIEMWKMLRSALLSANYEDVHDRENVMTFAEGILGVVKAAKTLASTSKPIPPLSQIIAEGRDPRPFE